MARKAGQGDRTCERLEEKEFSNAYEAGEIFTFSSSPGCIWVQHAQYHFGAWSGNCLYMRKISWIYDQPHCSHPAPCVNKMITVVKQFSPNVWTRYDWSLISQLSRYNQFLFYCFICLGIDYMNFFNKFILRIPANHKQRSVRLLFWAFTCVAASKEYFEFIQNAHCKPVGPLVWHSCLCLGVELSISFKFGYQSSPHPSPGMCKSCGPWAIICTFMLAGAVYAYSNGYKQQENKEKDIDIIDTAIDVEPIYENENMLKNK